jgi:hypothetical protein
LLEWDARIPEFPIVHAEVLKARNYIAKHLRSSPPAAMRSAVAEGPASIPHPLSFIIPEVA